MRRNSAGKENGFRSWGSKRRPSFWGAPQNGGSTLPRQAIYIPPQGIGGVRDAFLTPLARAIFLTILLFLPALKSFAAPPIYRIQIEDYIIHPITAEYIEKSIDRAAEEKAQALLIVLDTPGGLLQTTQAIVKKIMNAPIPIIVYVSPPGGRAASAGVFITLAAHVAAMAPTTHIGAAHPVELGGGGEDFWKRLGKKPGPGTRDQGPRTKSKEKEMGLPMAEKIMQDTLAWVEGIAKARGRNVDWAKKAVQESASITEEEALKLGVIDFLAKDEKELLEKLNGRKIGLQEGSVVLHTKGALLISIPLSWRQSILNVLINPNIAYILLTLGFYGLLFEITHPGSLAPGIAGLICILLAFYSFHIIPTSYAGMILTLIGLLLLGGEMFVTSHGVLALGGLVCLLFGALFLVDQPSEFLRLSLHVVIPTITASAVIFGFLLTLVLKSRRRKVWMGMEALVDEIGEAETDLNPSGKVFIHGEIWDAIAEGPVQKGEKVQILRLDNFKLYVRKQADS